MRYAGMNAFTAYALKLCSAPEITIQRSVGMRQSARYGARNDARLSPAPVGARDGRALLRVGSSSRIASTASTSPGIVATKNAIRHPYERAMNPLRRFERKTPVGRPSINTPIARARRSGGNRSPMSELLAGEQLASP